MHYQLIVALPGGIPPDGVNAALADAVNRYTEEFLVYGTEFGTEPGCGEWDAWGVGGRWHGALTLTPDAAARRSVRALDLPPQADCDCGSEAVNKTDVARVRHIDFDFMIAPVYRIDVGGRLHEQFDGGIEANIRFLQWIQTLPPDTWLVVVDVHR